MIYFLIGYMCSGKTTLAKKLAKRYSIDHIDLDEYIEKAESMSIPEIFNKYGEQYFRLLETKYLKEIADNHSDHLIVSCGGGTPIYNNNLKIMTESGLVIYLKCKPETIIGRLSKDEIEKRPLLKGKTNEELYNIINENIKHREEFYNQANIIINYETINSKWS